MGANLSVEQIAQVLSLLQNAGGMAKKVSEAAGTATLVGGVGGFFSCQDGTDIISAVMPEEKLSAWSGVQPAVDEEVIIPMLAWIGPTGTEAGSPDWGRSADCADCPSVEWGNCRQLYCFGEACAEGRDFKITDARTKNYRGQPMYRVQGPMAGTAINDNSQWQLGLAAGVVKQNLERQFIQGNKGTAPMESDGLMQLINTPLVDVRTNVRCQAIEPVIYDWASAAMSNNICNYLSSMVRRLRNRAAYLGGITRGDMIMLMTPTMRDALLDYAGCGCGPCGANDSIDIGGGLASRAERARLVQGGLFGDGMFEVDGGPVDIITSTYIPETQIAPRFCSDIYILTRRTGALPALWMEYKDYTQTTPADLSAFPEFKVLDGGRFISWSKHANDCVNQALKTEWRWIIQIPWLQARLTNVCAPFTLDPETALPGDTYFRAGATPGQADTLPTVFYGTDCPQV